MMHCFRLAAVAMLLLCAAVCRATDEGVGVAFETAEMTEGERKTCCCEN